MQEKKNLFRNTNYVLYILLLIVRVYKTVKLYWFFYLPLWYTWYHYSSAWEPEGDKWQYEKDCVAAEFHSISKPVGIESRDNKKEVGHLSLIFMALFCVISFNPAFLPNQITSWFIKTQIDELGFLLRFACYWWFRYKIGKGNEWRK